VEDSEASNGRVSRGQSGEDRPGYLMFGPYRFLPPGEYRAWFRVKGTGSRVDLEVATRGGRAIHGHIGLYLADGAFIDVPLSFSLAAPAQIEYRARWDGQGWAAIDWVAAAFAAESDPGSIFEVESLGHELQERLDPNASGGVAGFATPERTVRDAVWSGPLRRYPPGRYRLLVRLKLDRPVAGPFARCAVELASRGGELA